MLSAELLGIELADLLPNAVLYWSYLLVCVVKAEAGLMVQGRASGDCWTGTPQTILLLYSAMDC